VITCPVCKHSELDGTLFCSECGSRLWGDAFADETASFSLGRDLPRTETIGALVIPPQSVVTGITVRITGAAEPVQLSGKTEYMLGRADPKHDVIPDLDLGPYGGQHLGVSRRHASFAVTDTGLTVQDLGSTNGTQVNGRLLNPNERCPLKDGDEVRLGKLVLNIFPHLNFLSHRNSGYGNHPPSAHQ